MGQHKKHEHEVGTKMPVSDKVREHSFGSTPVTIGLSKSAEMATFGYKIRGEQAIWPGEVTSPDNKSGFPENRTMGKGGK